MRPMRSYIRWVLDNEISTGCSLAPAMSPTNSQSTSRKTLEKNTCQPRMEWVTSNHLSSWWGKTITHQNKNVNWSNKLDRFLKFRRKKHKSLLKPQRPRYSWHVHGPWSRQSWKFAGAMAGWTTNIGGNASSKEQVMMVRIIKSGLFCGYFSDLWRFLFFGWTCMAFAVLAATNYVEWTATL